MTVTLRGGTMDPLVELIHRWDTRHPYDHSLDGFPLTPVVVALLCILGVSLALGLTGRSWKVWYRPAFAVWFAWIAGVEVGRHGLWSPLGILSTVLAASQLYAPAMRTLRAAMSPSKTLVERPQ
jgi:hypothetical protein